VQLNKLGHSGAYGNYLLRNIKLKTIEMCTLPA